MPDESIVNNIFYTIMFFAVLGVLGADLNALILALSGIIVSFAFMIGTASSKYLEVGAVSMSSIVQELSHSSPLTLRTVTDCRVSCLCWYASRLILEIGSKYPKSLRSPTISAPPPVGS